MDDTPMDDTLPIILQQQQPLDNVDETMTLPSLDNFNQHSSSLHVDETMPTLIDEHHLPPHHPVVSKDVKLQTDLDHPHVAALNHHSPNLNPYVDLISLSTIQQHQLPSPSNGLHDPNTQTVGNINVELDHPHHSTPPPKHDNNTNERDGDGDGEEDTPINGDSGTDTYSDTEEFQHQVLTDTLDTQSKLELVVMNKDQVLTPTKLDDTKTSSNHSFLLESHAAGEGDESGTEEKQASFMKELETFFKERSMDFKPPKFYGEGLNLLKLWRAVTRLGGYEQVTSCKLWRQVGESFKPPKTCTTVSWTFRCFYEKALLEYEKHEMHGGELSLPDAPLTVPSTIGNQIQAVCSQGSGRARRDAAARAMQGWHSQRLLGNGEVGDPIIKDKNSISTPKREKQLKSIGLLKRKTPSSVERAVKDARMKVTKPQVDTMVVDAGPPADWVKINVRRTKDCFEVYALVPGLLREEVRVQSDPVGRLVISGEPEQLDNPWGVTPFKKVVSLPSRIDPHQTSAVVTLHGQLFVRVPFEQLDL